MIAADYTRSDATYMPNTALRTLIPIIQPVIQTESKFRKIIE